VIRRLDVLAWFACRDLDEAADAFNDAVREGHLLVGNDGDAIVALRLTALGKTYLPPTCPRRAPKVPPRPGAALRLTELTAIRIFEI
jgi:hypothetical protein